MKSFKTYIEEARAGGELNPFISTMDALEKYKDDTNVFITYTKVLKVGINPHSEYDTPAGVYTYPLVEAWKMYANKDTGMLDVPFAGKSPYVTAIRRKGKYIDDIGNTYKSNNYSSDLKKIYKYAIDRMKNIPLESEGMQINKELLIYEVMKYVCKKAGDFSRDHTIGGQMWNITRWAAVIIKTTRKIVVSKLKGYNIVEFVCDEYPNETHIFQFADLDVSAEAKVNFSDESINVTSRGIDIIPTRDTASTWTNIWLAIGYTSIADRSNFGIIHPAEKTQAVFFSKNGYDVLGTFENKDTHVRKNFNTWNSGTWTWRLGNWYDGVFKGGVFDSSRWLGGNFLSGIFKNGSFEGGTFSGDEFTKSSWHRGVFKGKVFKGSNWFGGEFKSGIFKNSKWKDGMFYGGTFQNSVWEKGTFVDGEFKSGTWNSGTWIGGKWKGGEWMGGIDKYGNEHPKGDSPNKWDMENLNKDFDIFKNIKK